MKTSLSVEFCDPMIPVPSYYIKRSEELEIIYTVLRIQNVTLTKTLAAKIVGGRRRLESLVDAKKIRKVKKNENRKNSAWECNAEDVFQYAHCNRSLSTETV